MGTWTKSQVCAFTAYGMETVNQIGRPVVKSETNTSRHPLIWVPSLYFAQGLPFAVVAIMASIMYKKMGISNENITYWTSMLGVAWIVKPLWSPFLEMVSSKKSIVVMFQILGGACMIACAFVLQLAGFFTFSIALLALVA